MSEYFKKVIAVFTKNVPSKSTTLSVDSTDLAKVTRTAVLMGLSTTVTYWLANVNPSMFGDHAGVAAIALTVLGEISLRFFKKN